MTEPSGTSRRRFLQGSGALAVGGVLGAAGRATAAKRTGRSAAAGGGRRPNILFLMGDEMRYPPVYETQQLKDFRDAYMPTQKLLRESGVQFNRHYAASTACAPSRASIFTGQYPSLHGVSQTTGAAKSSNDPDVFWLDPNSVPTMGDWFRAGGYRTFYRGKWHVSDADLETPGTHSQILSYDSTGARNPALEKLYTEADRLGGYGFEGWIGPEPHGSAPLNSGSSPAVGMGRDQAFASQCVELIENLDGDPASEPFVLVASFVNPHDIALWGWGSQQSGSFDFDITLPVPSLGEMFDPYKWSLTITDDLDKKPSCQKSYEESYKQWMQGIPPEDYWKFYYQLQAYVDAEMMKVYQALLRSRFAEDTIVVFTSDHGDMLGAHHYMHQKWYQTYEESIRVPLIIANANPATAGKDEWRITSHADLLPTLLGLAGLEPADLLPEVSKDHTDARELVGRDLQQLVLEPDPPVDAIDGEPIYFMTDDDPSRGLNQDNFYGVAYDSVIQPNHIECVIVELDQEVWKFSRYFDNEQYWSNPTASGQDAYDLVTTVQGPLVPQPGEYPVRATQRVKYVPKLVEYEMYNVTRDPLELNNLADNPLTLPTRDRLMNLLDQQRTAKRLTPKTGNVPGQPMG